MHDAVQRLKGLTLSILEDLDQADYMRLEAFVEQRNDLVEELKGLNPTEEISKSIAELLQYDAQIVKRMVALKQEASEGLSKIESGRQKRKAYDQVVISESAFFDKRK